MSPSLEKRLEMLEEELARERASKRKWNIVYLEEPGERGRTVEVDRSC
jgi:hypothetical protein